MYYEARTHQSLPVADAMAAATIIKTGKGLYSNSAPKYSIPQGTIFIVPDGHIDNPFAEVAVILQTQDGRRNQIESITAAWIKTPEKLAEYFEKAAEEAFGYREAILAIDGDVPAAKVHFTCGCCGAWFKSTIQQQKKFDQDAGFGICTSCETYYK